MGPRLRSRACLVLPKSTLTVLSGRALKPYLVISIPREKPNSCNACKVWSLGLGIVEYKMKTIIMGFYRV